jgi:light-regulated signal transduction histidine kinase (bacteriophytochrome)
MPTAAAAPRRNAAELEELAHAVSHDLAQPLTTIAGFSRLMLSRYEFELDAKSREYLDFIVKGATDMQEMIDGLVGALRDT